MAMVSIVSANSHPEQMAMSSHLAAAHSIHGTPILLSQRNDGSSRALSSPLRSSLPSLWSQAPDFTHGLCVSHSLSQRSALGRPGVELQLSFRQRRTVAAVLAPEAVSEQMEAPFLRNVLAAMVKHYLKKNLTAVAALDVIREHDGGPLCYDHFAFRTFGVDGCGINCLARFFLNMGYKARDELRFPAKKLRALWFSPPEHLLESEGEGVEGPLPRIFISELLVDELSKEAQAVIGKYTQQGTRQTIYAVTSSVLDCLTWQTPQLSDYQCLARESEYAAWTLVNGYALNHLTVSVHRLQSDIQKIGILNQLLQNNGIKLNSEGGILKVSPDGGLQQSSTVADSMPFTFMSGEVKTVPASYIEFAERLVLPQYYSVPAKKIQESHRRDGFEVGNADKIFESTSSDQTGVQVE
eukprot:c22065_g1_i1 orf=482-1714(-)